MLEIQAVILLFRAIFSLGWLSCRFLKKNLFDCRFMDDFAGCPGAAEYADNANHIPANRHLVAFFRINGIRGGLIFRHGIYAQDLLSILFCICFNI